MDKKDERRINKQLKENIWIKIVGLIALQVSFAIVYYFFNKSIIDLKDFSIEMVAISLTILSINISVYLHIHKRVSDEISEVKKLLDLNDKFKLVIALYNKELNTTLYQMYVSGIGIIASSLAIVTFNFPVIIDNMVSIFAFTGVLSYLFQLLVHIKSLNKVRNIKEKNNG